MVRHFVFCSLLAISLLTGQSSPSPSSEVPAAFRISGTMVDAVTGGPLSDTQVVVVSLSQGAAATTAFTREDGRFAFANLAAGKYTLRAQRRGYLAQSFNQHGLYGTSIAVGADLDSTNLVFPLSRECSFSGTITDEAGEAVPDAQVMLYQTVVADGSKSTRLRQTVTTDDEGFYGFRHLPPGRYLVAISARVWYAQHLLPRSQSSTTVHSGSLVTSEQNSEARSQQQASSPLDVAYPVTFYPGVTDPEGAEPVDVKPGDQFVANLSLQPVPAMHLRLDSKNPDSQITSVQLEGRSLAGLGSPVFEEALPTESGGMEVLGIPPGHYTVRTANSARNGSTLSSREIEVFANGETHTLPGSPSIAVAVTVGVDAGINLPHQGHLVFRNIATGKDFSAKLIEIGELVLPSGTYEITLGDTPGMYIKTISAIRTPAKGRTIEIKGISPFRLNLIIGRAMGQVGGVALRGNKPAAGAMVLLVPSDPAHNRALFRSDQSDSDGTFTLPSVVPGEYTLLAIEKGWDLEWQDPAVLRPYLSQGETLTVQQNGINDVKVKVQ
jgi:Carboxypeptidase regulatory-like domain